MTDLTDQIAALPVHFDAKGRVRVLMVTSRDTGRWVVPKGWTMDGKKPWAAAEIEALEEAGATGCISKQALGVYHYDKVLDDGALQPCRVTLYPMIVQKLKRRWKERHQRKRHWFSPKSAAKRVNEPELSDLILRLENKPKKEPVLKALLKAA
ncbi:NUDIX hydrolase [Psychromarinibacter sp. C21-152]|uniref:NUDIX hydrolase n=1 Tax=Psychromarinibacter sediminicola TaxID=3033385 RepID=A0AAE3NR73_9RHOB|nr:NUDIX hydrolase [Psychromarinibacter sediminicola]MDF0600951.1 NUDIX hydrolase [Psychromarinibacter sediminicola]